MLLWFVKSVLPPVSSSGCWSTTRGSRTPDAARIPGPSSVPIIGDLTTARVSAHAADEVKRATVDLVARAEYDALAAQKAEEERRALAAAHAADEFRKRYAALSQANRQLTGKAEKAIADDTSDDGARVGADDLIWLRNNR